MNSGPLSERMYSGMPCATMASASTSITCLLFSRRRTQITFEIVFLNVDGRPYPRMDAYWILDHTPEQHGAAPTILPDYAVERVMK